MAETMTPITMEGLFELTTKLVGRIQKVTNGEGIEIKILAIMICLDALHRAYPEHWGHSLELAQHIGDTDEETPLTQRLANMNWQVQAKN